MGFFLFLGILCLLASACLSGVTIAAGQATAPTGTPQPTSDMFPLPPGIEDGAFTSPRLAPPPLPDNPTQADLGAQVYYQVCMVCHGDRGQGLTDEWRGVLDPEDQNCWQSGCHHTRHPEGGFIFPKVVPPVIGPGLLSHYPTALQLHDFVKARMPWQARGTRSDEEYWQLTAFLLRENGIDPGQDTLDRPRAAAIVLNPAQATVLARPTSTAMQANNLETGPIITQSRLWIGLGVVGLAFAAVFIFAVIKRNKPN